MPVQLICASHSPLMTVEMEESQQGAQAQFFNELQSCAAALHKFNPDLVVVFGPDHFNGFFYEMMPAFCIGSAAEGTKDWHLEGGPLKVPRELAVECVRASAIARFRRGALARHEGRPRHHHPALQADRRAGALSGAAGVHQLRRRSPPLVPPRARVRRSDRRVPGGAGHAHYGDRLRRPVARSADAAHRSQRSGQDAAPDRSRDALAGRSRRPRRPRHQGGERPRQRRRPLPAAERAMGPRLPRQLHRPPASRTSTP